MLKLILFTVLVLTFISCEKESLMKEKFVNQYKKYETNISEILSITWEFMTKKSKTAKALKGDVPVVFLNKQNVENMDDYSMFRVAHSTLLFKIEGKYILTDPVFSNRASPFSFLGPKKFHKNPIEIKDLPNIDYVLLSHDHYDHLDEKSIKELKHKVDKFFVPLKVGKRLEKFGVDSSKIKEFAWWDELNEESFTFAFTPMQHFSGRGIFDRDKTLWGSWVIKSNKASYFFSGDGGYFEDFKRIGEKYGPFKMTFMENGAFNEKWKDIHMMPNESVQAHIDLKGEVMFPIHNGSFDLALHSWKDPFTKIEKEASKKDVLITYPKMGEIISLLEYKETSKWW